MFYAFWCGKSFLWRNAQLFVRESVKAWESSFQLVPSIETGFLYGPFSGNITQTKFIVGFGVELRQWFGRKKNSFCGIGSKVLCITAVDVSLWNGLTFGMSF